MVLTYDAIIRYLLKATLNPIFCKKWIKGDDLCAAISNLFELRNNYFTIADLTKALNTKFGKTIKMQLDVDIHSPVSENHIGIFRQSYRPRKGSSKKRPAMVYGFYFVEAKGTSPPSYDDAWYNHIIDFIELQSLIANYASTNGYWIDEDKEDEVISKRRRLNENLMGKPLSVKTIDRN